MFACISGQHIPAFESLRAFDLHLPVIIVTGSENRDTPIPRLVMEHVLNGGDNLSLICNMPCIVQFNDDCHSGFYSTEREVPQQQAPWQWFTLAFRTGLAGASRSSVDWNLLKPTPTRR